MTLFGFGKKKEAEKQAPACCCTHTDAPAAEAPARRAGSIASVKVLGAGCKTCHEQVENTKAAVAALKLPVEVEYITDMEKVMSYGVMTLPAIVINEQVVSAGKLLKAADVEKLLRAQEA